MHRPDTCVRQKDVGVVRAEVEDPEVASTDESHPERVAACGAGGQCYRNHGRKGRSCDPAPSPSDATFHDVRKREYPRWKDS